MSQQPAGPVVAVPMPAAVVVAIPAAVPIPVPATIMTVPVVPVVVVPVAVAGPTDFGDTGLSRGRGGRRRNRYRRQRNHGQGTGNRDTGRCPAEGGRSVWGEQCRILSREPAQATTAAPDATARIGPRYTAPQRRWSRDGRHVNTLAQSGGDVMGESTHFGEESASSMTIRHTQLYLEEHGNRFRSAILHQRGVSAGLEESSEPCFQAFT